MEENDDPTIPMDLIYHTAEKGMYRIDPLYRLRKGQIEVKPVEDKDSRISDLQRKLEFEKYRYEVCFSNFIAAQEHIKTLQNEVAKLTALNKSASLSDMEVTDEPCNICGEYTCKHIQQAEIFIQQTKPIDMIHINFRVSNDGVVTTIEEGPDSE